MEIRKIGVVVWLVFLVFAKPGYAAIEGVAFDGITFEHITTGSGGDPDPPPPEEGYFVDQATGSDANDGSSGNPWLTIGKANNTLKAGDTVYVLDGTYTDGIAPTNSGSAANRITYQNYPGDSPEIDVGVNGTGVVLSGRSYITIDGFDISGNIFVYMNNGDYNEITNCTIHDMQGTFNSQGGVYIRGGSQYNWIHGNTIYDYGQVVGGNDQGEIIYLRTDNAAAQTSYNVVEDNYIYWGAHNCFLIFASHNIWRNNYMHNTEYFSTGNPDPASENGKYGSRCGTVGGYGWTLFEGNRVTFTGDPPDNGYAPGHKFDSADNIGRLNMYYAIKGPGIQMVDLNANMVGGDCSSNYVYNNTFYGQGSRGGCAGVCGSALFLVRNSAPINNVFKNNITYESTSGVWLFLNGANPAAQTFANNWDDVGDPLFTSAVLTSIDENSEATNWSYPDFTLQAGSSCRNNGGFLTTITTATGSGTQFTVDDAHYFFDGWGIPAAAPFITSIVGDEIQLEGESSSVTITAINYATNQITVDETISWTQGDGVALSYYGSSPDQGAVEYVE